MAFTSRYRYANLPCRVTVHKKDPCLHKDSQIFSKMKVFLPFKLFFVLSNGRRLYRSYYNTHTRILDLFSLQVFHSSRYVLLSYSQVRLSHSVCALCKLSWAGSASKKTKRRRGEEERRGGWWLTKQRYAPLHESQRSLIGAFRAGFYRYNCWFIFFFFLNVAQSVLNWKQHTHKKMSCRFPIILCCYVQKTLPYLESVQEKKTFASLGLHLKDSSEGDGLVTLLCASCYVVTIALTSQLHTQQHSIVVDLMSIYMKKICLFMYRGSLIKAKYSPVSCIVWIIKWLGESNSTWSQWNKLSKGKRKNIAFYVTYLYSIVL